MSPPPAAAGSARASDSRRANLQLPDVGEREEGLRAQPSAADWDGTIGYDEK
jgi:hypothetical protein